MSRYALAVLAPVLALAAFAVMPAMAQAEPHWYKKNVLVGSTPVATTTVGALTLKALGAEIKCKVNDKEEIWNPAGGAGEDVMTGFALIKCKNKVASPGCPKGPITVTAENLPWRTLLKTLPPPGNEIRDFIFGVKLNVGCANSAGTVGDVFEGTLSPEVGVGVLVFGGAGGGTLFDPFSNPLTVTGADTIKAPPGKVTAKDP